MAIRFLASILQCFKQVLLSCCKTEWHSETPLGSHVPGLCSKQREVAGRPPPVPVTIRFEAGPLARHQGGLCRLPLASSLPWPGWPGW